MTIAMGHPGSPWRNSVRRHVTTAFGALVVLGAVLGLLVATLTISGAIISGGTVVFSGYAKTVQHPSGGVVKTILVHEGQRVTQGQVLMQLDPTLAEANRAIVLKGLDELQARRLRLLAERAGATTMDVPADIAGLAQADPVLAAFITSEQQVFKDRRAARDGQRQQLQERVQQIDQQIEGLSQQASAKSDETALIKTELTGLLELYAKNLVPLQRVSELQREEARLRGEHGQLVASIAEARGRITETHLQIGQIDHNLQDETSNELGKLESRFLELEQQRVAAEDQLARLAITAPVDGVVEGLTVHTIGGVVEPGSTIMQIAPSGDALIVEAKISPSDIDQVWQGQGATLRLSAFNQRTTPEIAAHVALVPADLTTDARTGYQYYLVRLKLDEGEMAKLGDQKIVPGMPVECFIQTGDRTILSYFVKPLSDQLHRAFKHD